MSSSGKEGLERRRNAPEEDTDMVEVTRESTQEGGTSAAGSGGGNENWVENECVLLRNGGLELERSRLQLAEMQPGSVLLRIVLAEVCGTDVHLLHGRLDTVPKSIIPGHVAVGRVHHTAGLVYDAEQKLVNTGDMVTFLDVIDTCNSCVTCMVDKQSTQCPRRRVLGITCKADPHTVTGLLGCWSSYTYLPPRTKIIRLPSNLSPQTFMAGGCGLPTAMHAVDRANIRLMDRVLVQGSGPVGLLSAVLARASGASQVIVIGAPDHRLKVMKSFGIDFAINIQTLKSPAERLEKVRELTDGYMVDIVIEATGKPEAISEGMSLCRSGGTYVVVGQYTDNGDVSINPHFLINRKHIVVKGSWGADFSHFYRGVKFMSKNGNLPWHLVVSSGYDLKDVAQALSSVEKMELFKALIRPKFPVDRLSLSQRSLSPSEKSSQRTPSPVPRPSAGKRTPSPASKPSAGQRTPSPAAKLSPGSKPSSPAENVKASQQAGSPTQKASAASASSSNN